MTMKIDEYVSSAAYKTCSQGNQKKFMINNRWYKVDDAGYEGLAETITSNLCAKSNMESFVLYRQEQFEYHGQIKLGCSSENFRPEFCRLVTADDIFTAEYGYSFHEINKEKTLEKTVISFVQKLSDATKIDLQTLGKYLTEIIELDAFTLNCDRHFNNIAFLRTDHDFIPAPIFDNGAAFLSGYCDEMDKDVDEIIPRVYAKPFSYSFLEQKEIMESLFGYQLEFKNFNTEDLLPKHILYPEKYVERILDIIDFQRERYPEMFIGTLEYDFAKAKNDCRNVERKGTTREKSIEELEP